MIKREGFFETNSSSTHALCIARGGFKEPRVLIKKLLDRYDWSTDVVSDEEYLPITSGINVSSFRSYDEDDCRTITLRRVECIGRVFRIYSSAEAKLNFIWSCLVSRCDWDMKEYLYKFLEYLYVDIFQYTGKHPIIKFGDIVFRDEPVENKGYNSPVSIIKLDEANFELPNELKGKYMVGVQNGGYIPKEELITILNDEKLFWNLVAGDSKIYTGSDETDLFGDLDFSSYSYKLVGGSDSGDSYSVNIFAFGRRRPIGSYINGNYETKIYEDGTRTRELVPHNTFYDQGRYRQEKFSLSEIDMMDPEFPESIDLKITNYCENNCPYCYANSNKEGKHADLQKVLKVIDSMKPYTEIALGGGNVLSYPYLAEVLEEAKSRNVIVNITVKDTDFIKYHDMIDEMIARNLIKSVGISPTTIKTLDEVSNLVDYRSNAVVHLVLGVWSREEIEKIIEIPRFDKYLFLGYKSVGKGEEYIKSNNDIIVKNIEEFKEYYKDFYSDYTSIAFDNLAIEQLHLDVDNLYRDLYQGPDGKFSFYIDLVEEEYAVNSNIKDKSYFLDVMSDFCSIKKELKKNESKGC